MSAQRYRAGIAHERMDRNVCPECGESASRHLNDARFWMPRTCDLLPAGVTDRIAQYRADRAPDVPEWVTDCTHDPVCGLESECRDLQREEAAADRAEEKRDDR